MVLFLDIFCSYLDELLLIKLSLTLENLIAKYQKVCEISWAKLGTKLKNLSPRLPMTAVNRENKKFWWRSYVVGKAMENCWF